MQRVERRRAPAVREWWRATGSSPRLVVCLLLPLLFLVQCRQLGLLFSGWDVSDDVVHHPHDESLSAVGSSRKMTTTVIRTRRVGVQRRSHTIWKWEPHSDKNTHQAARGLVAQYSGGGNYTKLLDVTSRVNRAYANSQGYDYLSVVGAIVGPPSLPCAPTYNKPYLVQEAKAKGYEFIFLLDADVLVVNFSVPVEHLVTDRVFSAHGKTPIGINIGVTLWNLTHPHVSLVLNEWERSIFFKLLPKYFTNGPPDCDDQSLLRRILRRRSPDQLVTAYDTELGGDFVAHAMRKWVHGHGPTFERPGIDGREQLLRERANWTCHQFHPACEV